MPTPSRWTQIVAANPDHSRWYIERFRTMAAQGHDLAGEARLIDAMVSRGSAILDAGCGPGRVGAELHRRGHRVTGVDVDPVLIAAAEQDAPGPRWLVGDLAELDLPERFDAIVCAGNVLPFCADDTRADVVARLVGHLAKDGRAVVGFGAGRGYDVAAFDDHVRAGGGRIEGRYSTWDLRPSAHDPNFLVAVIARA